MPKKARPRCAKCNANRKGRSSGFVTKCRSDYGDFNVDGAELFLSYKPREAVRVTARSLDQRFRYEPWGFSERHLPHVDNRKPGIFATVGPAGRRRLYLIEGFHRATNHLRDRSEWSAYVLTFQETEAIMSPPCRCRKKR